MRFSRPFILCALLAILICPVLGVAADEYREKVFFTKSKRDLGGSRFGVDGSDSLYILADNNKRVYVFGITGKKINTYDVTGITGVSLDYVGWKISVDADGSFIIYTSSEGGAVFDTKGIMVHRFTPPLPAMKLILERGIVYSEHDGAYIWGDISIPGRRKYGGNLFVGEFEFYTPPRKGGERDRSTLRLRREPGRTLPPEVDGYSFARMVAIDERNNIYVAYMRPIHEDMPWEDRYILVKYDRRFEMLYKFPEQIHSNWFIDRTTGSVYRLCVNARNRKEITFKKWELHR